MADYFARLSQGDSLWIKQYIGNFVSHCVVMDGYEDYYYSIQDLNRMDRKKLATILYNSNAWKKHRMDYFIDTFYGCDTEEFLDEVARYIDDRIPRAYLKYHAGGKTPGSNRVECDKDGNPVTGLKYHYSENKNPLMFNNATPKQISYLISLAADRELLTNLEDMSKGEARVCIQYFLSRGSKSKPTYFEKYFKSCDDKPTPADLMPTINWYVEHYSQEVVAIYHKAAEVIEQTDFSKTNPLSIHDARDKIFKIVERYGIGYEKFDVCDDCYFISETLKFGKSYIVFSLQFSIEIEYYHIPTEEIWQKMPMMVVEKFNAVTPEMIGKAIKEDACKRFRRAGYTQEEF